MKTDGFLNGYKLKIEGFFLAGKYNGTVFECKNTGTTATVIFRCIWEMQIHND